MSNASLKEQLQALAPATTSPAKEKHIKPQKQHSSEKPAEKNAASKPAWLEYAQYGVELLKVYFPNCFKDTKEIQPLKVGIKQDLVKRLASIENIVIGDKSCMVSSLSYYVNSPAYHKAVVPGAIRVDLDGNASGAISAEEAQYSTDCRKNRFQKKQSKAAVVTE